MWGRVLTRRRSVSAAQDCIRLPRKSRDFHGELSPTAGDTKILLGQNVRWLCWQSDANPSLPAKLGNCREIWPNCREQCLHIQQKTPCISVAWMGFSLIRGAGRTIILSREGRIRNACRFSSRSTLGSLTDTRSRTRDVCFTPTSGHARRPNQCPLCARSGRNSLTIPSWH